MTIASGILSAGFVFLIGSDQWLYYGLFACFSTFAAYNAQRLIKSEQAFNTPWLNWVKRHKTWLYSTVFIAIILAGSTLLFISKLPIESLFLLASTGFISAFYVLKIRGKSLRDRAFLKIHLIAIAWISVLLLFPVLNEKPIFFEHALAMVSVHYFYVLGVTIPFDIRDLKYDSKNQRTIPQLAGILGAKLIAVSSLLIFGATMLWLIEHLWFNPLFYVAVFVQIVLVLFMTEKRGDVYCAGLIDGSIALLGISYFLT